MGHLVYPANGLVLLIASRAEPAYRSASGEGDVLLAIEPSLKRGGKYGWRTLNCARE